MPVPPVLVATFRDQQLVTVVRRHTCGLPDEHLDPATFARPTTTARAR